MFPPLLVALLRRKKNLRTTRESRHHQELLRMHMHWKENKCWCVNMITLVYVSDSINIECCCQQRCHTKKKKWGWGMREREIKKRTWCLVTCIFFSWRIVQFQSKSSCLELDFQALIIQLYRCITMMICVWKKKKKRKACHAAPTTKWEEERKKQT